HHAPGTSFTEIEVFPWIADKDTDIVLFVFNGLVATVALGDLHGRWRVSNEEGFSIIGRGP
ncbi:MAG: hypothetical protein ACREDR_20045, partial [Blastocatellia bacterium]